MAMTIKTFADELAAVNFAGVTKRCAGIPKALFPADLPAQFADMPSALINPSEAIGNFGTFGAAAARYSGTILIAVAEVTEGFPDNQRTAVLDMAERVEAWAITTPYTTEITTALRIAVGAKEYRGVTARVNAPDMD